MDSEKKTEFEGKPKNLIWHCEFFLPKWQNSYYNDEYNRIWCKWKLNYRKQQQQSREKITETTNLMQFMHICVT